MTGAHSHHFIQFLTAILPLPQLILIPVGLASIVSYFLERRALVAGQKSSEKPFRVPQLVRREGRSPRPRHTAAIAVATAFMIVVVVAVSLYSQFRRELVLAEELRALEPYPGVIVMDTDFEHPWLLSSKSGVRSTYSTTAGFLAITEYYQNVFAEAGWSSLAKEGNLREVKYCKAPYAATLEYPEQELDLGYRYAIEIRVDGCS